MLAIIDIGSNSVRLLLKEKNLKEKFCTITKLSQNFKNGLLDNLSMERTIKEVVKFVKNAKEKNADIHIFSTQAVRSANNSKEFLAGIFNKTGLNVKIIDEKTEALIAFLGASQGKKGDIVVLDLGGASLEIAFGKGRKISLLKSLPLGVVTLSEKCKKDKDKLDVEINNQINNLEKKPFKHLIGVGGTITSLAAINLNLKKYDSKKVNGHTISKEKVLKLSDTLLSLSDSETAKIYGIQKGREDTIAQGSYFLYKVMDFLKADKIMASDDDNLEGYIIFNNLE